MKQILLYTILNCFFSGVFSQKNIEFKKKFEKEIGAHFFVFYPDEKLPSLSFNIRKIISPSFQVGAGITEIYIRYREAFYIPVYANLQTYLGNKKRLGANINAGYGFFNNKVISDYAWGPGKVIVTQKGSYYFSLGAGYSFKIGNKALKSAVNYVMPVNRNSVFIESTQELRKSNEENKAISVSLAYIF